MKLKFLKKVVIMNLLLTSIHIQSKPMAIIENVDLNLLKKNHLIMIKKQDQQNYVKALFSQGYETAALGFYSPGQYTYIEANPTAPDSTVNPIVSNVNPNEGAQHLSLVKDNTYPASNPGSNATVSIGTQLGLPEITDLTVSNLFSVDFNLTSGGSDYNIRSFQYNGGNFDATWYVNFSWTGSLRVVDDVGGGLTFEDTGFNYTDGQYYNLTIITDPPNNSIRYYIDGNLIYTGVAGIGANLFGGTVSDIFLVYDDNWQNSGETGDFDYFFFDTDVTPAVLDLALTKSNDATGQLAMGDTVNYTLTVDNIGVGGSSINALGTSTNIVVTDTLPAGMTFVSASCDDGTNGSFSSPTVTINLNDINSGNSTICTVVATVSDFGVQVNNAVVSSNGDSDNTNDTASSSVTGPNEVDMSIVKTSNAVGQVAENATVVYTLVMTNNDATDNATNIVVTDVLPPQVTYVSNNCGATEAAGTVTWSAVSLLPAGSTSQCDITVTVTGFGTFGNTATIAAFETDNTPANNTSSTTVQGPTAAAGVDLTMQKTSDAAGVQAANATVTYTLMLTNNSANPSTGTVVVDALPTGLTYVSNTCGATEAAGTVTWTIGTLAANANISCNIVTTVSGVGNISNTASATSNEVDNNTTNNSSTNVIQGPPAVDLSISKTTSAASPAQIGDTIIYTITVNSINTGAATGVIVTDTLPVELLYVSNTCGATEVAGVITWNIGNLGSGASVNCNITTTLDSSGTIVNTATVTANEVDIVLGNNSAAASIFSGAIIPTLSTFSLLLLILTLGFMGRRILIKD